MVDRDQYKQVRQDSLHACNEFPPSPLLLVQNSKKNKKGKIMHMDIIFSTVIYHCMSSMVPDYCVRLSVEISRIAVPCEVNIPFIRIFLDSVLYGFLLITHQWPAVFRRSLDISQTPTQEGC